MCLYGCVASTNRTRQRIALHIMAAVVRYSLQHVREYFLPHDANDDNDAHEQRRIVTAHKRRIIKHHVDRQTCAQYTAHNYWYAQYIASEYANWYPRLVGGFAVKHLNVSDPGWFLCSFGHSRRVQYTTIQIWYIVHCTCIHINNRQLRSDRLTRIFVIVMICVWNVSHMWYNTGRRSINKYLALVCAVGRVCVCSCVCMFCEAPHRQRRWRATQTAHASCRTLSPSDHM